MIEVVCRPAIAPGFLVAGVRAIEAEDAQAAAQAIGERLSDPRLGLILVEDRLFARLPEDLLRRAEKKGLPALFSFPGPSWSEKRRAEDHVLAILRRAVGYRVRAR